MPFAGIQLYLNTFKEWGMKKLVIIFLIVLISLAGGAGAVYMVMKPEPEPVPEEEMVELTEEEIADLEPLYMSLDPKFTITYNTPSGLRYLQLSLDVMTYEQDVLDDIKLNMPAVRNNIILLLSSQDFNALASSIGKQALRTAVLNTVQSSINDTSPLQEVFFTNFILQ